MTICFDARVILKEKTGIGNYSYNLMKSLSKIDSKNFYVVLVNDQLHDDHPIFSLKKSNLKIVTVKAKAVSVQQQVIIPILLQKIKPDLYHYPNWDVPLLQRTKTIFTIHDLTYLLYDDLYVRFAALKKKYTHHNINLGIKKAEKIIVVSESTKKDLANFYKYATDKIKVIHEAHDDCFDEPPGIKLNQKEKKYNDDQYFLLVGERRPHKNLLRIIEAFHKFKQQNSGYKLIIVGRSYSNYRAPEQLVQKLELTNEVIFYGYAGTEQLLELYQQAVALIFVSIYEGFGIPILEAMSCGAPVITSNISAMPEIAGDAAIIVDPFNLEEIAEAMQSIVRNKALKKRLIKKGKQRTKKFSWDKAAQETFEVYESVLK